MLEQVSPSARSRPGPERTAGPLGGSPASGRAATAVRAPDGPGCSRPGRPRRACTRNTGACWRSLASAPDGRVGTLLMTAKDTPAYGPLSRDRGAPYGIPCRL